MKPSVKGILKKIKLRNTRLKVIQGEIAGMVKEVNADQGFYFRGRKVLEHLAEEFFPQLRYRFNAPSYWVEIKEDGKIYAQINIFPLHITPEEKEKLEEGIKERLAVALQICQEDIVPEIKASVSRRV